MTRRFTYARLLAPAVALALLSEAQSRVPRHTDELLVPDRPGDAVDLAIALDISDSMEPLLDAARLELWEIVNAVAAAEPEPRLRVALLTFGSPRNDAAGGWVRVETDLTTDLDLVAERLFELDTGGGFEYVSRVVWSAVERLSWTPSPAALKMIIVAGNEPADQDPELSVAAAGELAVDEDVTVSTIYCGGAGQPDAESWKILAERAGGSFAAIDHQSGQVAVSTPYDEELVRLGVEINATFVPLGEAGQERQRNVVRQDTNAAKVSPATAAGRARTKANPSYSAGWDLISELDSGKPIYEIAEQDWPEELRPMSLEEREAYVAEQRARREEIQGKIIELTAARKQYIIDQVEARGLDPARGFDSAVQRMLRGQLTHHGFELHE